jgi:glycosyltransferase involved in cell wall biosynthesis
MMQVDVVLASFNGDKYIGDQILSILNQSYKNIHIIVTDDGSSDSTVEIIKELASKHPNIEMVNCCRQGGVVQNFEKGLSYSKGDYIFLADQDDIWLPGKVENALSFIKEKEKLLSKETPIMVFQDLIVVDVNLKTLSESFYSYNKLDPLNNLDIRYLYWRSTVYGCTAIFNKALKNRSIPFPKNIPMHDHWLALNAAIEGGIFFNPRKDILYRQHTNNVVGGQSKSLRLKLFDFFGNIKRIKKVTSKIKYQLEVKGVNLKIIGRRVSFVKDNVIPFFKERPLFSLFFIMYFIFDKSD